MRRLSLSFLALSLIATTSAHAALIGNQVVVQAPVTVTSQNTTSATWTPSSSTFQGSVPGNINLGTLTVVTSGPHSSLQISGASTETQGGETVLPFYGENSSAPAFFASIPNSASLADVGNGEAGWSFQSTGDGTITVSVNSYGGGAATLPAGVYTGTFHVQQWAD